MSSRSSVQASKTGDATKTSDSEPSKLDMLIESTLVVVLCLWMVYMQIFEASKKNPSSFKQVAYSCIAGCVTLFRIYESHMKRHQLLVEVSELKAELQKISSVPQREQAQEPCKVQCFQVEEEPKSPQLLDSTKKVQSTKTKSVGMESVEVKVEGKRGLQEKLSVNEIYKKSKGTWAYYQRLTGYKHKNPVCGAKKFQTFYVGNLSFKAKASDIQQAFEKHLSMKADSVVVARDSTGKSRGCAFITMRWNEYHVRNPGYNRDKDPSTQDKMWSKMLASIMSQQSICGRQIYVQVARSQRRD